MQRSKACSRRLVTYRSTYVTVRDPPSSAGTLIYNVGYVIVQHAPKLYPARDVCGELHEACLSTANITGAR